MSTHLTAILARARCDTDRHRTAVRWHAPCGTPHDLSYGSLVAWALAVGSVLQEEAALAPSPPPPPAPSCPATHAVPHMRIVAVGSVEGSDGSGELGVAAWPVLWLAVLLADPLVLLPLDAGEQQPTPRLRRMLDAAAPAVVVVETATQAARARAAGAEGRVVLAHDVLRRAGARMGGGVAAAAAAAAAACEYPEEAVSHVFFTSGSTGAPKGCVCPRRALRSYCVGKAAAHGVDAASVVLVASSHAFDPSLGDFVSTWASGACAALFAPDAVAAGLGACLRAAAATHCLAAPSLAAPLLQREGPFAAAAYPALRVVALGGEALPGFVAAAFAAAGCAARLANTYGVTECVGYQTLGFVGGGEASDVGMPLAADTSVVVVHDAAASKAARGGGGRAAVPVFAGEVWVAGAQVGLGYLVSPTQVLRPAERYAEHPVWGRCFKTGDIVELVGWAGAAPAPASAPLEGGRVHAASSCAEGWAAVRSKAGGGGGGCGLRLLGRRDGMVKLRGRRIEVAEVESCLRAGAAALLADVCVCLYEDKPRRSPPTLAAFCVVAGGWGGGDGAGEEAGAVRAVLRALCVAALPAYMVPGVFVLFVGGDAGGGGGEGTLLPRTASGKVDRRLLVGSAVVRSGVACRSVHNGVFEAEGEGGFKERYLDGREGVCAGACYSADGGDEDDDGEGGGGGAREPTPWERAVAGVWSEVLQLGWGADASGVSRRRLQRADFGELGGDSLQAVRVCKAVAAMVAARGGRTTAAAPAPPVPSAVAGGGGGVGGGVYGELLAEPLLPKELMRRPRLREYAQHLQEHYGGCCGDGSSGEEDAKKKKKKAAAAAAEEDEGRDDDGDGDDDDVPWTASAARAGNLSLLNFLCDAPLHTLLLPADAARVWGRVSPPTAAAVLRTNAFCVACLSHQEAAARALKARFDADAGSVAGGCGGRGAELDGATLHELLCRVVRRGDVPLTLVRLLLDACAAPPRHPARAVVLRRDAREGQTPLHHCARGGGAAKVLDALLEPLRAGGGGGGGGGAAAAAAATGRRGGGIGAEFVDGYGRTPLHWCVINAHAALVGLLVAADADGGAWPAGAMLAARDSQGETAVEMAERRAVCAAAGMRPDGVAVSVFGSIAKVLGGSGGTKNLKKTGKM